MDSEWRESNDWIHRDQNNMLLSPLKAINDYSQKCIREKTECNGFAVKEHYDKEIVSKLDKMKSIQPDSERLLRCLKNLRKKSFINLTQFNKNTWIYKDVEQLYEKHRTNVRITVVFSLL